MDKITKISVVIPVFNSENAIPELIQRLIKTFKTLKEHTLEIVMVNDGSTDNSWAVLLQEKQKYPEVIKAINLTKNYGQHNAILCGFNFCVGNYIVTMDDDLQHIPEEIIKLIEKQQETDADITYGIYQTKQHSMIRNFASSVVRNTSDFKSQNKEGGSSFRLIKKELVNTIIEQHQNHFLFLDAILNWYTGNVKTVQVQHQVREKGRSGYTLFKLFSIYLNVLYYYSTTPLKVIIYGGLLSSIVSFLIGLKFIYKKLMYDVPLGYTSIIVAIMFSTSLVLFCLGIIGNYLYKLYQMQQNKPPYSIKKII